MCVVLDYVNVSFVMFIDKLGATGDYKSKYMMYVLP